jgi:hypothetical protein
MTLLDEGIDDTKVCVRLYTGMSHPYDADERQGGGPDAFTWGTGKIFNQREQGVPITGKWQELSAGLKIRFLNRSGHNKGQPLVRLLRWPRLPAHLHQPTF